MAKQDLGLPVDVWIKLRDTITVIIHNAWTLDFNKTLSSFEVHVNLESDSCPFPEELQLDADVAVGNGYGESKYVSEWILAVSGLEATSSRIGQVSGSSSNGPWSTTDWVPAIVKSSIAMGSFPSHPSGVEPWLTPEVVSHTIVDAAIATEKPPFAINLVHPRPVS
ncbi:hypothetical protein B0H13DRAFT_2341919 [Mycena leptocephala]|nr:hypothetical protein B0H13DRAFT_2341919 [Mycena leptocephala]